MLKKIYQMWDLVGSLSELHQFNAALIRQNLLFQNTQERREMCRNMEKSQLRLSSAPSPSTDPAALLNNSRSIAELFLELFLSREPPSASFSRHLPLEMMFHLFSKAELPLCHR